MRIVHALESIDPKFGGPTRSATSLALAQAQLGHQVTLVCYREPQHCDHLALLRGTLPQFDRLEVAAIDAAPKHSVLGTSALSELTCFAKQAEVVHVHGVWRPFTIAAAAASMRTDTKLVVAPRGMLDPWSLRQGYWKKRIAMGLLWKRILNSSFFIHALNASEAELMLPLRLRAPTRVYPNGVFPEAFSRLPSAQLFRDKFRIPAHRRYILFLGRLHHKKGLDYLINAYARFCAGNGDTDLVIAGPDSGMAESITRQVTQQSLEARVHCTGPVYGDMKLSALAGATCFCLPSRQEGFSMAIIEALACGVPVVISEACHSPEVARVGAGEVVPLRVEDIAESLLRVVSDERNRKRARMAGRQLISSAYDWRHVAKNVLEGYVQ